MGVLCFKTLCPRGRERISWPWLVARTSSPRLFCFITGFCSITRKKGRRGTSVPTFQKVFVKTSVGESGKLRAVEFREEPIKGHQFLEIALFLDLAPVHHEDEIRVFNRGEAMGDDDGRLAFHELVESPA